MSKRSRPVPPHPAPSRPIPPHPVPSPGVPATVAPSGSPLWASLGLDAESHAQLTRLFLLLDKDGDGTLTKLDLPGHWDDVSRALRPHGLGEHEELGLDLPGFMRRMLAYTLSRPHESKLWDWRPEEATGGTGNVVSYGECIDRLQQALNRALQDICRELHCFVSSAAAAREYDFGETIGQGGFGSVRRVTARSSGISYALKLVSKRAAHAAEVETELRIMRLVGTHPNIVGLHAAFESLDEWAFVLELANGGAFFDLLASSGPYSESDAAQVVRQVGSALAHIHGLGVTHRDLKPENLLLRSAEERVVLLCDFGLSGEGELHGYCGTLEYMAPEIVRGGRYGNGVDIWALGVLLYNMLSARQPFDPTDDADNATIEARITAGAYSFPLLEWGAVSPQAKRLVSALLAPESAERIDAQELLSVAWVVGEAPSAPLPNATTERLCHFNADRTVWRAAVHALSLLVSALPAARITATDAEAVPPAVELRAAFDALDRDGDGAIDAEELRHVVRSLGAAEDEIELVVGATLGAVDGNGDGRISFEEFSTGAAQLFRTGEDALRRAFSLFDTNGDGTIDREEARRSVA